MPAWRGSHPPPGAYRTSGRDRDGHVHRGKAPRPSIDPGTARAQTSLVRRRTGEIRTPWIRSQGISVTRHAAALRPFRAGEFGDGSAAPSEGHLQAVNALLMRLRQELLAVSEQVRRNAAAAAGQPTTARLQALVIAKQRAHDWVRAIERIWDFYFELFGQRQSVFADWLLSCDRIALSCYQAAYLGVGEPKPLPAPPPFCYMRTGFSPATFRRGIPLRRLGRQLNPFPLVQLPYHRLVNPWTLGAVLHEVSHNLQSDLGLNKAVPVAMGRRLLEEDCPPAVVQVWVRWNREIFADLSAVLLGGPAVVGSLLDVVGRSPRAVVAYNPRGPHPTPWFRVYSRPSCCAGWDSPKRRNAMSRCGRRSTRTRGPGLCPERWWTRSPGPIPPSSMLCASATSPSSAGAAWPARSRLVTKNSR